MALIFCAECQQIEGDWREASAVERAAEDLPEDGERVVCVECGSIGTRKDMPEHDSSDMER